MSIVQMSFSGAVLILAVAALRALQLKGYETMSISDYQKKVWTLTDTEEYRDLLERFSQNKTLQAIYEGKQTADSATMDLVHFLYDIHDPLTGDKWQSRDFHGASMTDFPGASDNASLEYTATLTILDADNLTVAEYDMVRQLVTNSLNNLFQTTLHDLLPTELRDAALMQTLLDEEIDNIKSSWADERINIAIAYHYTPLGELPLDELKDLQPEIFAEWDDLLAPYQPFGLTHEYDQRTDEHHMYWNEKEVRAVYDTGKNFFISTHAGIGEGIYAEAAIDLYVERDGRKITGLREATPAEMEDATKRRIEITETSPQMFDRLRETVPATEEDYEILLSLKTANYRAKTIAQFNETLLELANQHPALLDRIAGDNLYETYPAALTDAERKFAATTTHFSTLENTAYVRSIQKNEPERDVIETISLPAKQTFAPDSGRSAWCSLYYAFSYHISEKETVRIGERDDCVGEMRDSIRGFWESSTVDRLIAMTEDELLENLHTIAAKYSSRNITITILDDQTAFETMDERIPYEYEENETEEYINE